MKLGMNLYVWTTNVMDEFFYLFKQIRKLGYDGVEVPVTPGNARNYLQIKRILSDEGLKCTTITNVGADANPISPVLAERQKALDQLKWSIDISYLLGSENMVGPYFAAYGVFSGKGPTDQEMQWSAEVMKAAAIYAREAQLQLSLEFLNRFETYLLNTTEGTTKLLDMVDEPNIGILYDTHHAHKEEHRIQEAIAKGGKRISYVHFSESHRGTLGSGLVDWCQTVKSLHAINYDGWVTAEAFSKNVPGLAAAAHVWRNTFDSPDQFAQDAIKFIKAIWANPACAYPTEARKQGGC